MWERETCNRCGLSWDITKKRSKAKVLCQSCRTRKSSTVVDGEFRCVPWHGRFAPDMVTPIHESGELVLPGIRICGNLDCCNSEHIQ